MATELVLLSPGPGRVVERLPLDFSRRFVAGESCRSIKSDPRFIEQREYILSRVFDQREASHERGTERQTASVDAEVALAALP